MKSMKGKVLTHKHIKRNLARPLARAKERGSQTQGKPVQLRNCLEIQTTRSRHLSSMHRGLGSVPSIRRVGSGENLTDPKGLPSI